MGNTWFPFAGYWWLYLAFTGLVVVLFATDLAYRRKDRAISIRGAAASTAIWMALAVAFSPPTLLIFGTTCGNLGRAHGR